MTLPPLQTKRDKRGCKELCSMMSLSGTSTTLMLPDWRWKDAIGALSQQTSEKVRLRAVSSS
eukprot:1354611-Rhodomonas_salina.2